jgi:alkanesulfonate monooxygenase SsuD/methylene tetrahydromethanopterin reductase-like flavin-dependent oxidoreductase (luciferase family)
VSGRFPLRVGVLILPDMPWRDARPVWERAEAMGFDHAWTYDHLAWRGLRDGPWFGAIPTLTAAATATARIRLGPLVTHPTYRHPMSLAKELITLDDISDGRLTLGIGSGGTGWDSTMLGGRPWTLRERTDRFIEFVELTDQLLRSTGLTWEGRYYSVSEARTVPGCTQRPRLPMAIAAAGARGMRLAAQLGDVWVTTGDRRKKAPVPLAEGVSDVAVQMRRLDAACAEVDRDPATLDRLVVLGPTLDGALSSVDAFADAAGRYADIGVTDLVVHWPRAEQPYRADPAVFERIFTG